MIHGTTNGYDVHIPLTWVVDNEADRMLINLDSIQPELRSLQQYKFLLQLSDNSLWYLKNVATMLWERVNKLPYTRFMTLGEQVSL